jgi:hypothetical protein
MLSGVCMKKKKNNPKNKQKKNHLLELGAFSIASTTRLDVVEKRIKSKQNDHKAP